MAFPIENDYPNISVSSLTFVNQFRGDMDVIKNIVTKETDTRKEYIKAILDTKIKINGEEKEFIYFTHGEQYRFKTSYLAEWMLYSQGMNRTLAFSNNVLSAAYIATLKDEKEKQNVKLFKDTVTRIKKARDAAHKACEEAKKKAKEQFEKNNEIAKDAEIDEEKLQKVCEKASNETYEKVIKGGLPPDSKGSGDVKKPSGPRQVVSARLSEQAALMVNIKNIVNKEFNVNSKTKVNRLNVKYNNFSIVRTKNSGHNRVTSRFTKNKDMAYFFDKLPTNVLSLLIPSIKIYKVFYPELHKLSNEQQKTGIKTTDIKYNQALKSSVHWRVPFDDTPVKYGKQTSDFAPDNLDDILNGNGSLRSVGIKSFNYEFSGNNPASAKAVVKASIKLFFENPADLVKEVPVKLGNDVNYTFSYSDLMNWSNRNNLTGDQANLPNEHYYRIKVVCGYGSIDETLVEQYLSNAGYKQEQIKDIINVIKSTTIIMFLSPFSYDVSFQENGAVELTINYNGQTETVLTTKEADIFYSTKSAQKAIELQSLIEKEMSRRDNEKDPKKNPTKEDLCQEAKLEKEIKEIATKQNINPSKIDIEKIKKQIINLRKESYNAVFKKLIGYTGKKEKEPQTHKTSGIYSVYIKSGLIETISSEKNYEGKKTITLGDSNDVKMLRLENVNYRNALLTHTIPKAKTKDSTSGKADLQKVAEQQAKAISDKKAQQTKIGGLAYTKIRFFFLGDILDAAMECMRNIQPIVDRPRVVIGEMPLIIPTKLNLNINAVDRLTKSKDFYSLADIPISFDLFQQFFLEKIVATERERYPVLEFIKDVIGELIIPAISPNVLDDGSAFNSKINYSTLNVTIPAPDGKDPLNMSYDEKTGKYNSNSKSIYDESTYNGIIIDDKLLDQIGEKKLNPVELENINNTLNYIFIYCSSLMPFISDKEATLSEIEKEDISNGVYHAKMGTDSGIVKKISFKKSDIPYQREMIARNNGKNLGTSIKQVYNADVQLFGNNIYYPGDYIYINPIFAFDKGGFVDLQEKLGIGGYYMVIKANTSVSESGFDTKLDCVYQASLSTIKDGKAKRVDVYNDDNCGLVSK